MKRSVLSMLPALALLAATAPSASASTVITQLSFDSLPSAQGWRYVAVYGEAGVLQGDVYSTTGTALVQNTMDLPYGGAHSGSVGYVYDIGNSFDYADVLSLDFTTKVTEFEGTGSFANYEAYLFVVAHKGWNARIGIKPDGIFTHSSQSTSIAPSGFDGSVFNNYSLILDTTNGTFSFSVNDILIVTGAAESSSGFPSSFHMVDGTGTANAEAELTHLVGMAIPEPSSFALIGGALALAGAARLRRKSVSTR